MAKQTYTKTERKAQFLETGVKLAKKNGLKKVSAAAVAKEHSVTAPLVFHIFGNREGLQKAVKSHAKKLGVALLEPAKKVPARKRSIAEVKAIKNKVATKKVAPAKKSAASSKPAKKKSATTATAKKLPKFPLPVAPVVETAVE